MISDSIFRAFLFLALLSELAGCGRHVTRVVPDTSRSGEGSTDHSSKVDFSPVRQVQESKCWPHWHKATQPLALEEASAISNFSLELGPIPSNWPQKSYRLKRLIWMISRYQGSAELLPMAFKCAVFDSNIATAKSVGNFEINPGLIWEEFIPTTAALLVAYHSEIPILRLSGQVSQTPIMSAGNLDVVIGVNETLYSDSRGVRGGSTRHMLGGLSRTLLFLPTPSTLLIEQVDKDDTSAFSDSRVIAIYEQN